MAVVIKTMEKTRQGTDKAPVVDAMAESHKEQVSKREREIMITAREMETTIRRHALAARLA